MFNSLDSNGNGVLDGQEYNKFMNITTDYIMRELDRKGYCLLWLCRERADGEAEPAPTYSSQGGGGATSYRKSLCFFFRCWLPAGIDAVVLYRLRFESVPSERMGGLWHIWCVLYVSGPGTRTRDPH